MRFLLYCTKSETLNCKQKRFSNQISDCCKLGLESSKACKTKSSKAYSECLELFIAIFFLFEFTDISKFVFSICGANTNRCEYQPVRIPTELLNYIYLFFKKQLRCKVKEMDLDNIEIYKRLTFDIICSYSHSYAQYTNVFFR